MIYYIFSDSKVSNSIKESFIDNRNVIINQLIGEQGIDSLCDNIIKLTSNKHFKKQNTHLFFTKPLYNRIQIPNKEQKNIILDKSVKYSNEDYQFYLDNFTSEDGEYENNIIDIKFDFLTEYLNLFEISYTIHNGTVEFIHNNIEKIESKYI